MTLKIPKLKDIELTYAYLSEFNSYYLSKVI